MVSVGSLWAFLVGSGNAMREMPTERMDWGKLYDPEPGREGKIYTNRGAFVEGAAMFDNERFGISDAEAQAMSPQQRVTLETAFDALLQAGVKMEGTAQQVVGTFVAESGFANIEYRISEGN